MRIRIRKDMEREFNKSRLLMVYNIMLEVLRARCVQNSTTDAGDGDGILCNSWLILFSQDNVNFNLGYINWKLCNHILGHYDISDLRV